MAEDVVASTEQMSSQTEAPEKRLWTTNPDCLDIDLDWGLDIEKALGDRAKEVLWNKTELRRITAVHENIRTLDVCDVLLNDEEAKKLQVTQNDSNICFELFHIPIYLNDISEQEALTEHKRSLRISPDALRHLSSTYLIPPAFMRVTTLPAKVCGTVFHRRSPHFWEYWCLIPLRLKTDSTASASQHAESTAGSNQMNPSNYISLTGQRRDIRPSAIGLYIQRDNTTGRLCVVCFNHMQPRFRSRAEKWLRQIKESLRRRTKEELQRSPCFVLLLFIAHSLREWENGLMNFNKELIIHERQLQEEISKERQGFIDTSKDLNVTLHIMAAHLHRYKTELNRIGLILSDLRTHRHDMTHIPTHEDDVPVWLKPSLTVDHEAQRIERLASYLKAISNFCDELEKKVQNILALLFNQIQAVNDRTLQAILNASQQENRVTHELSIASHMLSQSMKRDSIAMKTIAIMTLVFLPGATYAAVFAMPFFTETAYLTAPSQAWIWVILTVMCTVFAFAGYLYVVNRGDKKAGDPEIDLGQSSGSSAKSADGGSVKAT